MIERSKQLFWLLLLGIVTAACSAEKPAEQPKESPVEKSSKEPQRVNATNIVTLRKLVDTKVTVYGKISRTNKSRSGANFLNFYSSELSIVCLKDDLKSFSEGQPADLFKNKDVEVAGKIELYEGKLQIKLTDPSQIRLYDPDSTPSSELKRVELKEIDRNVWLSPVGLRYAGRDPQGLTRVEHIQRHVEDDPRREGPHGVFDGDRGVAFAVIDEAWQLAQEKKLSPKNEGDRSSYMVSLGRRVGYLGGSTGKERRNPPLKRVFIVFETGTKNIITAFPR